MHKCAIISDGQQASARAVSVVQLLSVADTRTGGLCGLLTASVITVLLVPPYPAIVDVCELSKSNKLMPPSFSSHTETSNEKKKHDV